MARSVDKIRSSPEEEHELSPELEAELDRALLEAEEASESVSITQVAYLSQINAVAVNLNNGQRLLIPAEDLQGVGQATPEQLRELEIVGLGSGFGFPALDVHFSAQGLLAGRYGNASWMEQLASRRMAKLRMAA